MSKGRILSIRLKNSQLMGVLDLLEIHLQSELKLALSTNIVDLLDIVISNARKSGDIPYYDNEDDAGLLLTEKVRNVGKSLVTKQGVMTGSTRSRLPPQTMERLQSEFMNNDFEPIPNYVEPTQVMIQNSNSNFVQSAVGTPFDDLEDVFSESMAEIAMQEEIELRQRLGLSTITKGEVLETAKTETYLKAVDKEDKRLKSDKLYNKVDDTQKSLLRIIYHNIPHSEWSSEKVIELLQSMVKNMQTL